MDKNRMCFRLWGKNALFTDPITKIGGEKFSYPIPTYQALKGIVESIYWKPTLIWVIDKVRVMKPIKTQSKGIRPLTTTGNTLSLYTYLSDVEYQCEVHFIWNLIRKDLENDRNENKHSCMMRRMLDKGGRRDIFLGTRECQGYVEPCVFGEGEGAFDQVEEVSFGVMLHGLNYPDETGIDFLEARLWQPVMKKGIVEFVAPEDCQLVRNLKPMNMKSFRQGQNLESIDELLSKEDLQ